MLFCNALSPQLFWFKRCRHNIYIVYFVCMCVNAGMWFERFIIIVGGLHRDFLPSSWGMFYPTWVDIWTFIGTFGIFLSLFLLFIRFLPMIAMSEVKIVLPEADPHYASPVSTTPPRLAERSAHENALRKQGLRNGCGIPERVGALRSSQTRARCWLQTLGCAFSISDSRNG